MKIKDFLKVSLDHDITSMRKEIRIIKNQIKHVEEMRRAADRASEKDLKKLLENDEELLKQYNDLSDTLKEKENKELQRMADEGIIKEVKLDSKGKIINE